MGQGAGAIADVKPSREIIAEIMAEAEEVIAKMAALVRASAR
jgi:NAD(P)H-dependent flavin oxidoreductase YrpB (nitropropane dioxygenase family)